MIISLLVSCTGNHGGNKGVTRDLDAIMESDTLRVVTMYGPASYFIYKDNELGYEYEMAKALASDMGVGLKLLVADSESEMIDILSSGEADLIAYQFPYLAEYKDKVLYTDKEYVSNQVILQCKSDSMVSDVLDLCGRKVYVKKGSIYDARLQDLDNEVGGGIEIVYVADSVTTDDLIASVAMRKLPMTVTTEELAKLSKTYFSNLDYSVGVSFPQRSAWVVNPKAVDFAEYINSWQADKSKSRKMLSLYLKYFEKSKYFEAAGIPKIIPQKRISQYDDLVKKYAATIGWDWRLLASVIYKESKFEPATVSWAGACGLMQLMPSTAKSLGIENDEDMFDPEMSISAGVKYMKKLEKIFSGIEDDSERLKFTLAAYNSGPGHILDARALAVKLGKNPNLWYGNVENCILLKSEPEFYTDSVCRFGYCCGEIVTNYVDDVLAKWEQYKLRDIK